MTRKKEVSGYYCKVTSDIYKYFEPRYAVLMHIYACSSITMKDTNKARGFAEFSISELAEILNKSESSIRYAKAWLQRNNFVRVLNVKVGETTNAKTKFYPINPEEPSKSIFPHIDLSKIKLSAPPRENENKVCSEEEIIEKLKSDIDKCETKINSINSEIEEYNKMLKEADKSGMKKIIKLYILNANNKLKKAVSSLANKRKLLYNMENGIVENTVNNSINSINNDDKIPAPSDDDYVYNEFENDEKVIATIERNADNAITVNNTVKSAETPLLQGFELPARNDDNVVLTDNELRIKHILTDNKFIVRDSDLKEICKYDDVQITTIIYKMYSEYKQYLANPSLNKNSLNSLNTGILKNRLIRLKTASVNNPVPTNIQNDKYEAWKAEFWETLRLFRPEKYDNLMRDKLKEKVIFSLYEDYNNDEDYHAEVEADFRKLAELKGDCCNE